MRRGSKTTKIIIEAKFRAIINFFHGTSEAQFIKPHEVSPGFL